MDRCLSCKTEIKKAWDNPVRIGQRTGYCETCRKMVKCGNQENGTGHGAAGVPKAKDGEKKEAARGGKKTAKRKTATPTHTASAAPPVPAAKRSGVLGAIADFFEL